MKIKLIDFGVPESRRPFRPHGNDAGADVYMPYDCTLQPGGIAKIPLGFGIEIPDGYAGYIFPRTSMAVKGLVCELPPVDSGYRGEIHAIISNVSSTPQELSKGARIGQLVITPVVIADFVTDLGAQRGTGGFGSTGTKKCYFGSDSWIIAGSGNEHTGKIAGYTNRRAGKGGTPKRRAALPFRIVLVCRGAPRPPG